MKYMIVTVSFIGIQSNILTIKVEQQMRLGTVDIQEPLWSRYRKKLCLHRQTVLVQLSCITIVQNLFEFGERESEEPLAAESLKRSYTLVI